MVFYYILAATSAVALVFTAYMLKDGTLFREIDLHGGDLKELHSWFNSSVKKFNHQRLDIYCNRGEYLALSDYLVIPDKMINNNTAMMKTVKNSIVVGTLSMPMYTKPVNTTQKCNFKLVKTEEECEIINDSNDDFFIFIRCRLNFRRSKHNFNGFITEDVADMLLQSVESTVTNCKKPSEYNTHKKCMIPRSIL